MKLIAVVPSIPLCVLLLTRLPIIVATGLIVIIVVIRCLCCSLITLLFSARMHEQRALWTTVNFLSWTISGWRFSHVVSDYIIFKGTGLRMPAAASSYIHSRAVRGGEGGGGGEGMILALNPKPYTLYPINPEP